MVSTATYSKLSTKTHDELQSYLQFLYYLKYLEEQKEKKVF